MNYRHAYHAGNFADVLKHAALISVILHLRKKPAGFAVIDTHAGRGLYDLTGSEAGKTREAENGVLKLSHAQTLPGVLAAYMPLVQAFGPNAYPGSPLIAAKLLRDSDRLVAVEKHPEEHRALADALRPFPRAGAVAGDGYQELARLVPPAERRGIVLVDPPYEVPDEFQRAARAVISAYRRFATGIYLLWYPAKEEPRLEAVTGELLTAGISELLRLDLDIGSLPEDGGLSATGLLVVNPPYRFAAEMEAIGPFLAERLGRTAAASFSLRVLAGEG
jgi:23S rRNA (adenine2030-N6)-methyltransferase